MEPALHHWYTSAELVAAFGGNAGSERLCDGEFILLPRVVLGLVTLGDAAKEPHVSGPSDLVWRPRRLNYDRFDHLPWFPKKVREVYDYSQTPIKALREHHVALRTQADEKYIYGGRAHLGSYASVRGKDPTKLSANFTLNTKLPRDVWLKFGGYPGWYVELNHNKHHVNAGDLPAFERLAQQLTSQKFSHLGMTRYEEDSLNVHANARRGWLMYLTNPADPGIYARDREFKGDSDTEEVFQCVCGIDLEFPESETVPRELATRAVLEFFRTGELPHCVDWAAE